MLTDVLRRFNRTWTQRIGALDESFLGTGRPLAASRLLFEIGSGDASVLALRERLDLDSGHLSRLLRRLEDDGLVATEPDPADRRRRTARLTPAGRTAYDDLEQRSARRAEGLVEPLTPRQQERLAEALTTADLLVRAATVQLREVGADEPAARAATGHYLAELDALFPTGFDPTGFDPGPAQPEPDATWVVATSDGAPVAHGGIRPAPAVGPATAEIKRMWVDATWRGAGLGSRMLRHLEDLARRRGHDHVVLDTNGRLHDAIAMYDRAGYRRVERYNDNPYAEAFFAKDL